MVHCLWFAHLCVGVHVCASRPGNEAMCMNALLTCMWLRTLCLCACLCVLQCLASCIYTSGDSSVVSCCFIYYH